MDGYTLNTMFQNGMPSMAAMQLGRQMPVDNQMMKEKLLEQQLQNQRTQVMNPLDAMMKQQQIEQTKQTIEQMKAQLPGIEGQSKSLSAQGDYDTQTLSSKIASQLSKVTTQMGEDGVKRMGQEGTRILQVSQALDQYPPALHKEVLAKTLSAYGGDPKSPMIQGIMQMPDAQVKASLEAMGKGMAMASADYMRESALHDKDNASREKVADLHAAGQIYSAQLGADSRKSVAETQAEARMKAAEARAKAAMSQLSPDKQIVLLENEKRNGTLDADGEAELQRLKAHVYTTRAAGANALPAQMVGEKTPIQNAQAAAGMAQPQASIGAEPDLSKYMQEHGMPYEPDKYMYKLDPATGKVFKAPLPPKR